MTTRRDFVKYLALVAAGMSAMPQQIEAFEKYYEANTPYVDELVAVDSIILAGLTLQGSMPVKCEFFKNSLCCLNLGINTFGGIMRWSAMPDSKIIVSEPDFFWKFTPLKENFTMDELSAEVSYVNSKYERKIIKITKLEGSLVDP